MKERRAKKGAPALAQVRKKSTSHGGITFGASSVFVRWGKSEKGSAKAEKRGGAEKTGEDYLRGFNQVSPVKLQWVI